MYVQFDENTDTDDTDGAVIATNPLIYDARWRTIILIVLASV